MIAQAYPDELFTEIVSVVAAPASSSSLYICNTRQIHEHMTYFPPIAPSYTDETDEIEVLEKSQRAQRDSSNSSVSVTFRAFGSCPVIPGRAGEAFAYLGQLVAGVHAVAMAGIGARFGVDSMSRTSDWQRCTHDSDGERRQVAMAHWEARNE